MNDSSRMKIRKLAIIFSSVTAILVGALYYWLNAPYINARMLLSTLDRDRGRRDDSLGPSMCGLENWKFSLNTFTDELDLSQIRSLYQIACEQLESEFGKESLLAYTYLDQLGYGRQITVVRIREGLDSESYLAVTFLHNNDNHMIRFEHTDGTFVVGDKKASPSWQLQSGQWEN